MPSLGGLVRKLRWSVAQRGVLGTMRFAIGRASAQDDGKPRIHPFDVANGVDTSGLIGGSELATGHAHDRFNTAYYGMSPSRFRGAVALWKAQPPQVGARGYAFVDLGCGKGRALLLATEEQFKEVVGVELHPELARVARENLSVWKGAGKGVTPARVICGDATEFEFPPGPCLLYLFNPFGRPVMDRLVQGLARSFADRPGLLDVLYFNPEAAEAFEARSGFELRWSGTIPMDAQDAAADLVAGPDDLCHLYRWIGDAP